MVSPEKREWLDKVIEEEKNIFASSEHEARVKGKGGLKLAVRRIIVLVESQYQELELWYPLLRLREAGIEAKLVGINVEETFYGRHGFPARAEMAISLINARDFDGVIIPGGFAPDYLRRLPVVLNLVREFYQGGKLVALFLGVPGCWSLLTL